MTPCISKGIIFYFFAGRRALLKAPPPPKVSIPPIKKTDINTAAQVAESKRKGRISLERNLKASGIVTKKTGGSLCLKAIDMIKYILDNPCYSQAKGISICLTVHLRVIKVADLVFRH